MDSRRSSLESSLVLLLSLPPVLERSDGKVDSGDGLGDDLGSGVNPIPTQPNTHESQPNKKVSLDLFRPSLPSSSSKGRNAKRGREDSRLLPELIHHLRTHDSIGETREVLYIGGGGELTSSSESVGHHTLDEAKRNA